MRSAKAQQAIDAAITLFGEQGFDNTSTQSIAKAAGIGNATLFKYFASKDVLIRDCYLECKMQLFRAIKEGLDPTQPFESFVRHIWVNFYSWALANRPQHNFILQIANSRFYDPEVEQKIDAEMLFFQVALQAAIDRGDILGEDLALINATMVSFVNLAVSLADTNPEIDEKRIYALMLNSLKVKPSNK